MTERIPTKLIESLWCDLPTQDGQEEVSSNREFRYNHRNCPAGLDTKKRLYLRMTEDETKVLAYCHNCGGSGVWTTKEGVTPPINDRWRYLATADEASKTGLGESFAETVYNNARVNVMSHASNHTACGDCVKNSVLFKGWSADWCVKYQVVCCEIPEFGARTRSLILPASFDENGVPNIVSIKTLVKATGKASSPKWLHIRRPGSVGPEDQVVPPILDNPDTDRVVIVEDRISAIRIVEACKGEVSVCTLSGTNISEENIFKLAMLYPMHFIWLDNDSQEVMAKTRKIEDNIKLYGRQCQHTELNDPKGYDLRNIKGRVEAGFKT